MEFVETVSDLSALTAWLGDSYAALQMHCAKQGAFGGNPSWDLRYGTDGAGGQVQFWWHTPGSRFGSEMLWDYVNVSNEAASDQAGLVKAALGAVGAEASPRAGATLVRPRPLSSVPMFDFHPQRFRALYPTAKAIANAGVSSPAGGFTESVMQATGRAFMRAQDELIPRTRTRRNLSKRGRPEMDLMQLAMFFADFHHSGKQIFDFPAEMVEMFRRTDVDGIPLEAIKLPYKSMYLHFGRQEDLAIEGGWAPDGAYVALIGPPEDQAMQFCLTFAPRDPQVYEFFLEAPEPSYVQAVSADQMKIGVGEAVDLVVSERIAKLKREVEHGSAIPREDLEQVASETGWQFEDSTKRFAKGELELLPARHKAWVEMLRLVVNGLAYLSAYPEDWADQVGPGVGMPWSISSELSCGEPMRVRKAHSKLAELGYTAVHFCGVKLRQAGYGSTRRNDGDESERDAWTWVRGHWRRQAYGPQWSLHKLRWLMPFKRAVHGSEADSEDGTGHGHVYVVT